MSLFLRTVPVDEAIRVARGIACPPPAQETVPLAEAYGRVLAVDITADVDIPGFDRSVVDGYAVRAADTTGAGEAIPSILRLSGEVLMGQPPAFSLAPGEAAYVPTGAPIPGGADAMVMVEHAESLGDQVLIKRPAAAGENVIRRGEDFSRNSPALTRGRRLHPQDIGVLAAVGCERVPVFTRPRIGVISTGNELVPVSSVPTGSQVRDCNSVMLGAFIRESGCIPRLYGVVRDDWETLREILITAARENDAIVLSGGSSKDERDLAASLIHDLGEVLVHGVAIAPGKPTIIGRCRGKPVLGLPGHPASAFVVLDVIGAPFLMVMTGESTRKVCTRRFTLAQNVPSQRGREDYVRIRIEEGKAVPLFGKSGLLNTLVKSDGMIRIPAGSEGLEKDEQVEVILW